MQLCASRGLSLGLKVLMIATRVGATISQTQQDCGVWIGMSVELPARHATSNEYQQQRKRSQSPQRALERNGQTPTDIAEQHQHNFAWK